MGGFVEKLGGSVEKLGGRLVKAFVVDPIYEKGKRFTRAVTDAAGPELGYKSGEELREAIKNGVIYFFEGVREEGKGGLEKKVVEATVVRDSSGVEIPIYDKTLPPEYQPMVQLLPNPSIFSGGNTLEAQIRKYAEKIGAGIAVKTELVGGEVRVDFYRLNPTK